MRRILLVTAAIAAVATAAVWFAAQESYVTTVKATVGTSLTVSAHGSQNYGLVFGQEVRFGSMNVAINAKAKADRNLTGVQYEIACNPPEPNNGFHSSICPNLTISPFGPQKLVVCDEPVPTTCISSQSQLIQWTFVAPDCEGAAQKKPAGVKTVGCSQDQNWLLDGAVSIDVTGYQGDTKEQICDKKTGFFVNGTTGEVILVPNPEYDLGDPTTGPALIPVPCIVGGDPFPPGGTNSG